MHHLKIAFITGSPFGTIGTSASCNFVSEIIKHHEVIVLSPQTQPSEQPLVFHNSALRLEDIYDAIHERQLYKAWHFLCDFKPDIVHLFNHRQAYRFPFFLRHLLPNAKWVLDIRSPLLGNKRKRRKLRRQNLPLTFFIDAICTHSHASVPTHLPFSIHKIVETPPGVNLKNFHPSAPMTRKVICRNFVFIGSLSPLRNIEFLIENFAALAITLDEHIHLDIIGGGPAEKRLCTMVESTGIGKFVRLVGVKNQNELLAKLSSYDAGIAYVPNGPHETAPSLKSIEFAASGIPIIASDTLGHQAYIKRGFEFITFKNKPASFKQVLRIAIQEGVAVDSIHKNLQTVAGFDWVAIVQKKLLPLYDRLTKGKSRKRSKEIKYA
jgi:glycosyltransferase involved in cell wall biosynthesis